MKTIYFYLIFFLTLTVSPVLLADETWDSTFGKVIYEEDIGTTALWSYVYQGNPGLIYIDDLAGVYEGRGYYQGYWVQPTSDVKCKTQRMMKGRLSSYWGLFQIQFLDPKFPARWQAKWSYCEQKPTEVWKGSPITN